MPATTAPTTTDRSRDAADTICTADVRVCHVDDGDTRAAWARYVEQSAEATLFHHPDWCESVARVFGHRPRHLLAKRGDQFVGVLPLMQVNSWLGGRMLLSVPYGNAGGILASDDVARDTLARAAAELAETLHVRTLDLRSITANAHTPGYQPIEGYLGFRRSLPLHPNDVPAFLPKRARAAGRHARDRDGVTVQHDVKLARVAWNLYCRSMRRIASVNYPFAFFEELIGRLGDRAWVSVAWKDDRPLCGAISFVFGDTISPYVLGADERIDCNGGPNLLFWSIMERAVRSGIRQWDYGRSRADNKGAVGFKKNQGFAPEPLGYQRYVPTGQKPPNLKPSNPKFAIARRAWGHLPLWMSRPLGAWLARSIPG